MKSQGEETDEEPGEEAVEEQGEEVDEELSLTLQKTAAHCHTSPAYMAHDTPCSACIINHWNTQ